MMPVAPKRKIQGGRGGAGAEPLRCIVFVFPVPAFASRTSRARSTARMEPGILPNDMDDELFRAIERVAEQKRQRAEMMRQGVDPTLEKAQGVISAAAQELARRFENDGFSYAKSAKKLSRKAGDWTQEIYFGGTGMNVPGREINFEVHALLKNAALKKWQKTLPSPFFHKGHVPDYVTVISPRLRDDWPVWNLHEPSARPAAIDGVEHFVREEVMPILGMFNAPHVLVERLVSDTSADQI